MQQVIIKLHYYEADCSDDVVIYTIPDEVDKLDVVRFAEVQFREKESMHKESGDLDCDALCLVGDALNDIADKFDATYVILSADTEIDVGFY